MDIREVTIGNLQQLHCCKLRDIIARRNDYDNCTSQVTECDQISHQTRSGGLIIRTLPGNLGLVCQSNFFSFHVEKGTEVR